MKSSFRQLASLFISIPGYILEMISRVCQWPFEARAFIVSHVFRFAKIIVSVNLRGVAMRSMCHRRSFIRLILADENRRRRGEMYVYDGRVLSEDYASFAIRRNFFQSYCAPLLCNAEKRGFYIYAFVAMLRATFREKQRVFVYLRIFYLPHENVGMTEADFKLNG